MGHPLDNKTTILIARKSGLKITIKMREKRRSKIRFTIRHGKEISDFVKVRNGIPS
jgi:hypothetical protein